MHVYCTDYDGTKSKDEATSALDTTTEREIQVALQKLGQGRTTVEIAHRLSTIVNSDLILVMDKGRIVERGSHVELLERRGIYSELWAKQIRWVVLLAGSKSGITDSSCGSQFRAEGEAASESSGSSTKEGEVISPST